MTDPLKVFMQANALTTPAFAPDSRYYGVDTGQWTKVDGTSIVYAKRRFIPRPEKFATASEHVVEMGDRLDRLANEYLGDPQQYWLLCDGNGAVKPEELVSTIGKRLRITLPEGIPSGVDINA